MVWPFGSKSADASASACPVDHETRDKWVAHTESKCPVNHDAKDTLPNSVEQASETSKCPVNHSAQAAFLESAKLRSGSRQAHAPSLSMEREVSSIPRYYMENSDAGESAHSMPEESGTQRESHWVYPSAQQFYSAVRRKNHDADAADMDVVVPIHNAVNEEAWRRILDWERGWNTQAPTSPQLVNFLGRPRDVTWRAWMRGLAGYQMPFDRHDWVIVRPSADGTAPSTMRYIIDFYAGRASSQPQPAKEAAQQPVSFYLDVRPAPSTLEGLAMRVHRFWASFLD